MGHPSGLDILLTFVGVALLIPIVLGGLVIAEEIAAAIQRISEAKADAIRSASERPEAPT